MPDMPVKKAPPSSMTRSEWIFHEAVERQIRDAWQEVAPTEPAESCVVLVPLLGGLIERPEELNELMALVESMPETREVTPLFIHGGGVAGLRVRGVPYADAGAA